MNTFTSYRAVYYSWLFDHDFKQSFTCYCLLVLTIFLQKSSVDAYTFLQTFDVPQCNYENVLKMLDSLMNNIEYSCRHGNFLFSSNMINL